MPSLTLTVPQLPFWLYFPTYPRGFIYTLAFYMMLCNWHSLNSPLTLEQVKARFSVIKPIKADCLVGTHVMQGTESSCRCCCCEPWQRDVGGSAPGFLPQSNSSVGAVVALPACSQPRGNKDCCYSNARRKWRNAGELNHWELREK